MMTRLFVLLATLPGLAACATSAPELARPDIETQTPGDWRTFAPADAPHVLGWSDISDGQLAELLAQALQNNPDLQSLALARDAARIGIRDAEAARRPGVTVSGPNAGVSDGNGGSASFASLAVAASYELDFWGRLAAGVRQQELVLEGAGDSLLTARIGLAADIALTYHDIRTQDALLQLRAEQLELLEQRRTLQDVRLEAGAITRLDLDQLDVEILRLRSTIEDARARRALSEQRLAALVGEVPQSFSLAAAAFEPEAIPRLAPGMPAEVLLVRPDIRNAERGLERADISVHLARTAFYPSFGLSANGRYASSDLVEFLDGSTSWSAAADMTTVLFSNGTRRRNVERAQIGAEQAVLAWRSAVLSALTDVENALLAQDSNLRQIDITARQLEAQIRVTRAVETRYDAGTASMFELIAERQREIALREQRIRNWQQGLAATVGLLRALAADPADG